MAWRLPGDKPLSEPMMVSLLTHVCVTQPQWVNGVLALQKSHAYLRYWKLSVWQLSRTTTTAMPYCKAYVVYHSLLLAMLSFPVAHRVTSLWPSDAFSRHRTWSSLVQVMACRLLDAKPFETTGANFIENWIKNEWSIAPSATNLRDICIVFKKCIPNFRLLMPAILLMPHVLNGDISGSIGSRVPYWLAPCQVDTVMGRHVARTESSS